MTTLSTLWLARIVVLLLLIGLPAAIWWLEDGADRRHNARRGGVADLLGALWVALAVVGLLLI